MTQQTQAVGHDADLIRTEPNEESQIRPAAPERRGNPPDEILQRGTLPAVQLSGTVADERLQNSVSLLGQSIEPAEVANGTIQDPGTRHLGPVAQDFYAAFNVGPDGGPVDLVR